MGSGELPIEAVVPELKRTLSRHACAVLAAPPGAGKTTRVPLALLAEPWLAGGRIVMLEPRRLAARSAARYMAAQLGEQVGGTVGYRVRMDTRVGSNTRIEVVTEGVLTRMLQADPGLDGVGAVLFDEFHERSLQADLGLALCLQAQELFRPDLRLLAMSATLDVERVAGLMGDAPVVRSEGRAYPVETRYLGKPPNGRVEPAVAAAAMEALARGDGDVLVFLPGTGEIRRVEALLRERLRGGRTGKTDGVEAVPLHGGLSAEEQDAAVRPSAPGTRKVVLSTSIAETSVTVEGIRTVVDSGLMRVSRFSPRTGMSRLETVPVSLASADQRRGRAGRTAPGVCYRLWSEEEERRLPAFGTPEIGEADLAPLALDLAAWGTAEPGELRWLDPPPGPAYAQARELLRELGALDADGAITPHGRELAAFGAHPRLAHMIVRARPLGAAGLACELAALLGERDPLRGAGGPPEADIRLRVRLLRGEAASAAAVRRIAAEAARWKRLAGVPAGESADPALCGALLALAYPDRIAQRRPSGAYTLSGGRGAVLRGGDPLAREPYLVCAELDDQGADGRIDLAAPVALAQLEELCAGRIVRERTVEWDAAAGAVRARESVRLGALTLREAPLADPAPEQVLAALVDGIRREGLRVLPWTKAARQFRDRLQFMHEADPGNWPDISEEALLAAADDWLAPHLYGMRSRGDLQRLPLLEALEGMLAWERRRALDREAPTHVTVPSGSRIPVLYGVEGGPALAVRLQELFGWQETPRIAGGRVPLTIHLLSPAHRPVQVTRDLTSFWREAYFEVKKDLKGRYPKHYWPDDPLAAAPTNRTRPKRDP